MKNNHINSDLRTIAESNLLFFTIENYDEGVRFYNADQFAEYQADKIIRSAVHEVCDIDIEYYYPIGAALLISWTDQNNNYHEDSFITKAPCFQHEIDIAETLNNLVSEPNSILGYRERDILNNLFDVLYDKENNVYIFRTIEHEEFEMTFDDEPKIIA